MKLVHQQGLINDARLSISDIGEVSTQSPQDINSLFTLLPSMLFFLAG